MTPEELLKVLVYNEEQNYTAEQVKTVQEVIGVPEVGVWSTSTIKHVVEWQKRRGLKPDGMVGSKTWEKIREESERTDPLFPNMPPSRVKPIRGIWVDDSKRILREPYWDEMQEHGISSVALMFEGMNEEFNPDYTYDEIEKLLRYTGDRGMVLGITDWPWPTTKWMNDMYKYVRRMFDPHDLGFALSFHESDVEGNWMSKNVKGFPNLDKAGDRLVEVKTAVVEGGKAAPRRETTSFTSHTENGRSADVAPHMDAVFNQGYAVRSRKKSDGFEWLVPWEHSYGPGNMAKLTFDRSMQIPGMGRIIKMGAGLAAYDQKWPGHSAQEAMMKSYLKALEYLPFEIRWWSWKWIFGHLATSYGKPFLKSIM